MSSDPIYAEFGDGARLWGMFYGTTHTILPRLYDSKREVEDLLYLEDWQEHFVADKEALQAAQVRSVPVKFYTCYGNSSGEFVELNWHGKASRADRLVVGPFSYREFLHHSAIEELDGMLGRST